MSTRDIIQAAAGAGGAVEQTDPYFENTVLLLHGDGTNGGQNNTFLDSSTNNFTITRNGNTTQGSFSPYGNLWSNYFDGSGDYLTAPDNAAFAFGTGDFTVECWTYHTATKSVANPVLDTLELSGNGARPNAITFYIDPNNKLSSFNNASQYIVSTNAVLLNSWSHLAMTRVGTTVRLFINGNLEATATRSMNLTNSSLNIGVTANIPTDTNGHFSGYISNLRVIKGTALYTSNFTPSTTPLTAVSGTSLLTCQSNRFIDNSSNNFTITRNGDVRVTNFAPFAPSAAYSASTNGASGYFDGSGDYLTAPDNAAFAFPDAFTFETWFYPDAFDLSDTILLVNVNSGLQIGRRDSGSDWGIAQNGVAWRLTSTTLPTIRQWNHIVVVRSGTGTNQTSIFLNGTRIANGTVSTSFAQGELRLNTDSTGGISGYLSNARLVKGVATYNPASTTISIPTAPLTAVSGTSLLLNFANAAIFDNTQKNDLETVGNAQISTSVKKYGTGSIAFDGTGDWLLLADRLELQLGTGNFTVEGWLYLGATGAARGIVGKGTSTTGWLLSTNSSNQVVFTYASSTITSTGTLAGSTWYHIAVCRNGTGSNQTKIYINGTNDGTGTVSTDFNQTNVMYVGANRTGGDAMNGYIDDLRITKGIARYTGNFTPPNKAFPNT